MVEGNSTYSLSRADIPKGCLTEDLTSMRVALIQSFRSVGLVIFNTALVRTPGSVSHTKEEVALGTLGDRIGLLKYKQAVFIQNRS
jgi:hypothetical protein